MDKDDLSAICKYPPLSREEEVSLGEEAQKGNQEAIDKLVNHNFRLVASIAKSYVTPRLTLSDAINEGTIGLIKAARTYDPTRGTRFSTHATWQIRSSLQKAFWEQKSAIMHVPQSVGTFERSKRRGEKLKESQLELLRKGHAAQNHCADVFGLPSASQPSTVEPVPETDSSELALLREYLPQLTAKDQFILKARYGLAPYKQALTLEQIADIEGVGARAIFMRWQRAIERLRALILNSSGPSPKTQAQKTMAPQPSHHHTDEATPELD